jgi:hypothetical protein
MNIYLPYFYIIQHSESGKYYAGCKFGKNANPANFMVPGGYITSSKEVNKIIKNTGLESFEIIALLTEDDIGCDVYQFETTFLQENNISANPNWFNCHNNTLVPFGTPEFEQMMIKKHGVEHGMHIKEVKEKLANTNLSRYGVKNPLNTPEKIKLRILQCIEKYGSANNFQKIKQTNLKKYGVENLFQPGIVRDRIEENIKNKYGGMGNASPTIFAKHKETLKERYGVNNSFQIPEVIQKTRQATIDRNKDPEYKKAQSERIKQSLEAVDRSKENNSFFGKTHSEESRRKISDAKKGRKAPRYCCISCRKEVGVNNLTQHTNRCTLLV